MDQTCNNEITSEEYADVISSYRIDREEFSRLGIQCIHMINENWVIFSYPLSKIPDIGYNRFGYFRLPALYAPADMTSMEASGVTRLMNNPKLDYTGKDVLIGIVDTGIDYANEVFLNSQGKSRVYAIWDQAGEGGQTPPEIGFGRVYTREEINQALEQENPYESVPGDILDGHGTFQAGIAAGSYIDGEFAGAAPEADIVMVRLKPAKQYLRDFYQIPEAAVAYSETDIMFAVKYLNQLAGRLAKPMVILVGLGTTYGPHNGGTPLGSYLADVAGINGIVVVAPTGNEGNGRRHFEGQVLTGQSQQVEINVGRGEKGFILELWGNNPDVYTVEIVSPSGERIPRIPAYLDGSSEVRFVFEPTRITVDYSLVETVSGKFLITMRFVQPTEGVWRIFVYGNSVLRGTYNMWLPIGSFLSSDTYFLNSNPDITLTSPGAGEQVLTVSAYDHYNNSVDLRSGRGFNSDGAVKPDIAAPGVNVYGPVRGDRFSRRSGSSIAAAHAAGCSALLLEWGILDKNQRYMNTASVKNYLIKGADRSQTRMYPDRYWGYGTLNIYNVFESLRTQ